jgi:hypothetical protein
MRERECAIKRRKSPATFSCPNRYRMSQNLSEVLAAFLNSQSLKAVDSHGGFFNTPDQKKNQKTKKPCFTASCQIYFQLPWLLESGI